MQHGSGEEHAAHAPLYVVSSVTLMTALVFLTAYFVTTLAERLRQDEQQLEVIAKRALAERQLLEQSLETTGTALRVVEREQQSCWRNSKWKDWFGRHEADSPATLHPENPDSPSRQTFEDGQVRVTEVALRSTTSATAPPDDRDPSQRILQVTTAPLFDSENQVHRVVELAQDITEQKRAHAKMIRTQQLAAVGELAGQVAHEVNNPIAILGAKARLLLSDRREELTDETVEEVGKIIDLSDRVARIARGLLSSCRPSGAARELLNILDPLHTALTMVEQRAALAGVQIVHSQTERVLRVRANAEEMVQLFLNLLLNALDAMPDGGQLTVSARSVPSPSGSGRGDVNIEIEDTGCGIPEDSRERVFEPFYTTKRSERGIGLGLSICQGLARSHDGRIALESRPGRGTRVTVTLPTEEAPSS